jgi:hypothetical protein
LEKHGKLSTTFGELDCLLFNCGEILTNLLHWKWIRSCTDCCGHSYMIINK